MKFIEKIVDWVLNSSADPSKTSLAVRGALVLGVGIFVKAAATACAVGVSCVVVDQNLLGSVVDALTNVVFWACSIIGAIGFIAGVIRKLFITLTGQLA